MDRNSIDNNQSIIRVVDASGALGEFIAYYLGIGMCVVLILATLAGEFGAILVLIFIGPLTYLLKYTTAAKKEGYVIDVENDTFTFPGGRRADELEDYLKIEWWRQRIGLERSQIRLSEITNIAAEDRWETRWNETLKRNTTSYSYEISIQGTFGTITNYLSKGKRNQLYSMLQQTLNMGNPVVITNE